MTTVTPDAYNLVFHVTHGNPDTPAGWTLDHGPSMASTSPGSTGNRLRVYSRQTDPGEVNVVFTYLGSQPANFVSHPLEKTFVIDWADPSIIGANSLTDVGGSSFVLDVDPSDYPAHVSSWALFVATSGDESGTVGTFPSAADPLPAGWSGPVSGSGNAAPDFFLGDFHYDGLFRYIYSDFPNSDPGSWTLDQWGGIYGEVVAYAVYEFYGPPPSGTARRWWAGVAGFTN